MHVNITVTVIVVAYMLIMLYIGWASSKRIKSNSDFMVAGRRLGPILMAGTLTATEIGGGSSLGVVQNGMSGYGLTSAWYIIAIGIAFIIMSFLAPMFRKTEIKTVPEYFRRRYGKGIGLITSIVTFIPLVGLTAGQFIAAAVVLSTMLGINYKMAVIITAGVVTAYSIMGGLWSVSITDNVQMVLIIFGMAIAIPFALSYAGGWSAVTANIPEGTLSLVGGENGGYDIISIIGLVVMYVATFSVGQEAVSRFYAAKDEKAAKQGAILSAICNFIYAFIPAWASSTRTTSRASVLVTLFLSLRRKLCRPLSAAFCSRVLSPRQCPPRTLTCSAQALYLQMISTSSSSAKTLTAKKS